MKKKRWKQYEVKPVPIDNSRKYRKVYEAFDSLKKRKVIIKRFSFFHKANHEYQIMKYYGKNIYLPAFYEFFTFKGKHHIVMEFIDGCLLADILERHGSIEDIEAIKIFMGIVKAVKQLHDIGLYHNDIKTRNIMLDKQNNVKIIDMGRASKKKNENREDLHRVVKMGEYLLTRDRNLHCLPDKVQAILKKGIHPEHEQRYKTADEILADLANFSLDAHAL